MANNLWLCRRFVMHSVFQQHKYCMNYDECRVVFKSQFDTEDLVMVNNGKVLDVTYSKKEHWVAPNKRCNEYVGLFVMRLAQPKLFRELPRVRDRLIYRDTDSAMFTSKSECRDLPVEVKLEDFSNDLNGKHFTEFLALSNKTYCQLLSNGDQRLKCKGISKTENLKARVNMNVTKRMVFAKGPGLVEDCNDLKRNPKNLTIQTTSSNRRISGTLTSRVIGQNFWTCPYGSKNIPFPL